MRFYDQLLLNPVLRNIQTIAPLNSTKYSKSMAIQELQSIGWRYYGGKHYESRWTHFFQSYYLPIKCLPHMGLWAYNFSSMIGSIRVHTLPMKQTCHE